MEIKIHTHFDECTNIYEGGFFNYYQIHIFSVPYVISTYYDPEYITTEQVKETAINLLNTIRKRTSYSNQISLFEKNGKFLITESDEFFEGVSVFEFDEEDICYNASEEIFDFVNYLGDAKADAVLRNVLTTVGAEELYGIIEPQVKKICQIQDTQNTEFTRLRELSKIKPTLKLEIYRIEKNYIPVKVNEFLCYNKKAVYMLPEHNDIYNKDERMTFLIKEISSDKIIEGDLNEDIEGIKQKKWSRKNPSVIDGDALFRMELDNDDPDFLSWDDYVSNYDEHEEGDDEYTP